MKIQTIFATIAALLLTGMAYMTFVFPKTVAQWADQGRELSSLEYMLANLSDFSTSYGLFIIPLLLIAFLGCIVWALRS
ncbi:hypothetical protein BVX97_06140 [bacterium E08(2017)]|nr:hypothetical protein BVX97_06140 [bacterium E08(2017)]